MNDNIKEFLKYLDAILPKDFSLSDGDSLTVATTELVSVCDKLQSVVPNKNIEYPKKDFSSVTSFSADGDTIENKEPEDFPREVPHESVDIEPMPAPREVFVYAKEEFV